MTTAIEGKIERNLQYWRVLIVKFGCQNPFSMQNTVNCHVGKFGVALAAISGEPFNLTS